MFIPGDYKERFGDVKWSIPESYNYFGEVCYADDGSPVAYKLGEPFTVKVGKRKFMKVTIDSRVNTS